MDPATLAASVAALVAPYLRKAGEEFAGEAGQYVQKKAGELWSKLRAKFDPDPRTKAVLDAFEANPDPGSDEFKGAIEEKATSDQPWSDELAAELTEIKRRARSVLVVQRMDEAERVVGIEGKRIRSEKVEVQQDIKKATDVIGIKVDEI
jgi:hypothetical protein